MFSPEGITSAIQEGQTSPLVEYIEDCLKKHSLTHPRDDPQCDFLESLPNVLRIFNHATARYLEENIAEDLLQLCLKFLKTSCVHGKVLQGMIVQHEGILEAIKSILETHCQGDIVKKWTWHLLANAIVDNVESLKVVWPSFGNFLLTRIHEDHENSATTAAVIYYTFRLALLNDIPEIPVLDIFSHAIAVLERNIEASGDTRMDFIHLCFEYLITESDKFGEIFSQLTVHDRIWTIFYITDHIRDTRDGDVRKDVLLYLPREFNRKSECILNSMNPKYVEDDPKEVMALLRCFVAVTGNEKYGKIYMQEASFFINICALLVAVQTLTSQGEGPFAPLEKLENFSKTSQVAQEAEKEIFFELRTLLVRLIANLTHKNRKNQDLAREMKALLTICGCTTMDARNPMMKEWAIVALKNLLEGNEENQNMIRSLVNQGPATNSALAELMMENGTVRINRNQQQ